MLREISTQVLINMKINAHQAIIGLLLMSKEYDYLEKYLIETNSYDTFEKDLKRLAAQNLVTYNSQKPYSFKSIVVKPMFIQRFSKGDNFMEFFETYPVKVTRPDGAADFLRKDRRMCKDVYSIVTKDAQDKHDHIMNCLRYEIKYRERSNSMRFMKRMYKWLSEREWENFEDLAASGSSLKPTQTYGTQLE